MSESDTFYLILGCYGRSEDKFICCSGIENCILQVSSTLNGYNQMLSYFDSCKLFDKPLFDYNAVRSFLSQMQSRFDQLTSKLFTERQYQLYHKFIIDHKNCGLIIRLATKPIILPEIIEPKLYVEPSPEIKQQKLTIVR